MNCLLKILIRNPSRILDEKIGTEDLNHICVECGKIYTGIFACYENKDNQWFEDKEEGTKILHTSI